MPNSLKIAEVTNIALVLKIYFYSFWFQLLGLDVCSNVLVGDPMHRGISGGQKKRVTTGTVNRVFIPLATGTWISQEVLMVGCAHSVDELNMKV